MVVPEPSAPAGYVARALFRGTLKKMVTRIVPTEIEPGAEQQIGGVGYPAT